jgi:molecular chaperone IbpA
MLEDLFGKDFKKFAIGFEPTFNLLEGSRAFSQASYPPYDIVQLDDTTYLLNLAVAGFNTDSLNVYYENGLLTVEGTPPTDSNQPEKYLYKGISSRHFIRKFSLGDDIEVVSSDLRDGLLTVRLERFIPEHKKRKDIQINAIEPVAKIG